MEKILIALFLGMILTGCNNKSIIYFYSPDKSQCVTLIDEGKFRYIANGKINGLPKENYVKLFSENVPVFGDAFYICWKNTKYEWDIVIEHYEILESKLDSTKFRFNTSLPSDERGIPTPLKYSKNGCAEYSLELKKFFHSNGTTAINE